MHTHSFSSGLLLALTGLAVSLSHTDAALLWHSSMDGDASGIVGPNGTAVGTPTAAEDLNGNPNGAVRFNGSSDYFNLGTIATNLSAGTMSFWANTLTPGNDKGPIAMGASGGGSADEYFSIQTRSNGSWRADVDNGSSRLDATIPVLENDRWYHIVATFSAGGQLRTYVDGVLSANVQNLTAGHDLTNLKNWLIGAERVGGRFYNGALDDVRLWDEELDAATVLTLFNDGPLFGVADSDQDGMADSWEQQIIDADPNDDIMTVEDVLPGDDFDNDLSTNEDERLNSTDPNDDDTDDDGFIDGIETNDGSFDDIATDTGTDPRNPDTDGDSLPDGVETNDGTFDDIATDTGTNPLDRDSDSDGLDDDVETNDMSFDDETDTGTDPNNEDTDGDDFRDGAEVNNYNTDPLVAASLPDTALNVLFIGGNEDGTQGADGVAIDFIQDKYGLSNVVYLQASAAVAGSEDGFDLLVLSSTPASGALRGKFQGSLVPIVNWEEAISDSSAVGEFGMSTAVMTKSTSTTEITMTGHPIAGDLPDTVVLFGNNGPQTTSSSSLFTGLVSGGDAPNGNAMILLAEAGDAVDPGVTSPGNSAPARRVMMPFTDSTIAALTDDGFTLFGNAMDWAAGRLGASTEAVSISAIDYDESSDPGNIIVTLTFTSQLGEDYSVFTSTDLETPLVNWSLVNGNVVGGDGMTIFPISFDSFGISKDSLRRFFVVRESED